MDIRERVGYKEIMLAYGPGIEGTSKVLSVYDSRRIETSTLKRFPASQRFGLECCSRTTSLISRSSDTAPSLCVENRTIVSALHAPSNGLVPVLVEDHHWQPRPKSRCLHLRPCTSGIPSVLLKGPGMSCVAATSLNLASRLSWAYL